jgi:hypothetical protein
MFYRAKVKKSNCDPYFSEVYEVITLPLPNKAHAGRDTLNACTPIFLNANESTTGMGKWTIISEKDTAASLKNDTLPSTILYGLPGSTYKLEWRIYTVCDTSRDTVTVGFMPSPDKADTGNDTTNACTPLSLYANKPSTGKGQWRLLSGTGGKIDNDTSATSSFMGIPHWNGPSQQNVTLQKIQ